MHVKNLHWVVVEDGLQTYPVVERIIQRTTDLYTYMFNITLPDYPRKFYYFNKFFFIILTLFR